MELNVCNEKKFLQNVYDMVKEFWNQALIIFEKDKDATPFIYYDKNKRFHFFSNGETVESYNHLLSLSPCETLSENSLVVSPEKFKEFFKLYLKEETEEYVLVELFLLIYNDLKLRVRLADLIAFENRENKGSFPLVEYPMLVSIFNLKGIA
ncbi:hypothetical protein [Bacillus sp. FSL M8-0168]|uniref:hypothetical protein n=1 Tax=Bacillus sp. FSL M8-0168 TaxID=2921614 RepID=UPI0030FD45FF